MKKNVVKILVVCAFLATMFFTQSMAFAEVTADWTLLAADDFTAEDNTTFQNYTGGSGFTSGWTSDLANTSTTFSPDAFIKNGQYYTTNKNQTTNAYRRLQTPIDLTTDADYYIMFDMYSWANGNSSTSQRLLLCDSTDPNKYIYFGSSYAEDLGCNLPNIGANYGENFSRNRKIPANGIYTYVVHISAKSGTAYDSLKIRVFTDLAVEAPSFTPQYWDEEYWLNNKAWSNLDTVNINSRSGSGSTYNPIMDNLKIYQAAPISVTWGTAAAMRYLSPNVTLTISVAPTNQAGNPQTAESIKWYDATNTSSPVELASGASYTVPTEMIDKILRAEVIVKDEVNNIQSIYYPVSRLVHAPFEVIKTTVTSTSNRKNRINYVDWTKNTSLYFNAEVTRAKGDNGGSVQLIVAQYTSDGMLKKVVSATPIKISNITPSQTLLLQALITLDHGTLDPQTRNYASGDYFKAFVWYCNGQTFAFDRLSPMHFNVGNDTYIDIITIP